MGFASDFDIHQVRGHPVGDHQVSARVHGRRKPGTLNFSRELEIANNLHDTVSVI